MILIVHEKGIRVLEVRKNDQQLQFSTDLCETFWSLAREFPDEVLVWVEDEVQSGVDFSGICDLVEHELIMSSYAVKNQPIPEQIGYIDQMPFVKVIPGVRYPTWRMSSDIGGMVGKTILKFRNLFQDIRGFDYLLNSLAKLGQQNGLFCYSDPAWVQIKENAGSVQPGLNLNQLFTFVYQHYKTIWTCVLFFCLVRYERKFPLISFLRCFSKPKFFKETLDLSTIKIEEEAKEPDNSIDVIIPTLGRGKYVQQVVMDLANQTLVPQRVIVVEQDPEPLLTEFFAGPWPFEIVHIKTTETGACMARNKALPEVQSEWVFFADDDIRLGKDILAKTIEEAKRLRVNCLNLSCRQMWEPVVFHKIKQWGSFGSGTSFVRSKFAKRLLFSEVYEYGYGEDADYGMKLRQTGCDIIYHPGLEILHLKAPTGGFRETPVLPWDHEIPVPKPSPTITLFARRYYTPEQMHGFKISLFLKYFKRQKKRNPIAYLREMDRSWKKSLLWAEKLEGKKNLTLMGIDNIKRE